MKRGRLRPHYEIQPMLRNAGKGASVEYMDHRTSRERIAPIAIFALGPDRADTHTGHECDIGTQLDAPMPRAAGISIVEARGGQLVGNERVTHVSLKHGERK